MKSEKTASFEYTWDIVKLIQIKYTHLRSYSSEWGSFQYSIVNDSKFKRMLKFLCRLYTCKYMYMYYIILFATECSRNIRVALPEYYTCYANEARLESNLLGRLTGQNRQYFVPFWPDAEFL